MKFEQTTVAKPNTSKTGTNGTTSAVDETTSGAVPPALELDSTGPIGVKRRSERSWLPVSGNTEPTAEGTGGPTPTRLTHASTRNGETVIVKGVPSPAIGRKAARTLVSRLSYRLRLEEIVDPALDVVFRLRRIDRELDRRVCGNLAD